MNRQGQRKVRTEEHDTVSGDKVVGSVVGEERVTGQQDVVGRDALAEEVVIPVVAEELAVGKREMETGRVRVIKTVREREELVDEPTIRDEVHVERVPINQFVETAPAIRHEGDTMIVPVLEEVLVVEKRLRVKEELHITRLRVQERSPQRVTLRTEDVAVERADARGSNDRREPVDL